MSVLRRNAFLRSRYGGLICNFCGRAVAVRTMPAAPGLGYSLQELQNNVGRRLQSTAKQVVCGTCGGTFLAESSSISGLCPYCGSNSITVAGNATGTLEPTGVIPFKISKDEAQAMFKQWISGRRLSPMDIAKNSEITALVGVYVPYWVFDCDTYTPYNGKFGKTYGSGTILIRNITSLRSQQTAYKNHNLRWLHQPS